MTLRYNVAKRVMVLEVADVAAFSKFVSSLVPSKRIGIGTQLLTTPADYGDRYGSACRLLEDMEQYCRETADLTVDLVPGIDRFHTPADERGLLLLNIRIAKEQLRRGTYPADVLRDIASSYQHLSLALGRYTSGGLRQKKNFSAPREPDRYITSRDEWIQKRVDALLNDGIRLTTASKLVMGELGGEITDRQIRNICRRAGIGSRTSRPKKAGH